MNKEGSQSFTRRTALQRTFLATASLGLATASSGLQSAWAQAADGTQVPVADGTQAPAADANGAAERSRTGQSVEDVERVQYVTPGSDQAIAERFRLATATFDVQLKRQHLNPDRLAIYEATFPSPVVTEVTVNNTVHCEYYLPLSDQPCASVIVLHILGGDFALSRLFCHGLASRGIASLFLKMPYYGPRRDPNSKRRMISEVPEETVEGMTQAVLDIRRATAWLGQRPELDPARRGIFGISLGAITAALAASQERDLAKFCLLLGGGDLGRVTWEAKELSRVRERWLAAGRTREDLIELLKVVDPVTYAERLRGRPALMMNALDDEVIPRACTDALWEAAGKPEIVWYPGTHYTVARHLLDALGRVCQFFGV